MSAQSRSIRRSWPHLHRVATRPVGPIIDKPPAMLPLAGVGRRLFLLLAGLTAYRFVPLAIDENRARKKAFARDPSLRFLDTAGLMVEAIQASLLTVAEADAIKVRAHSSLTRSPVSSRAKR